MHKLHAPSAANNQAGSDRITTWKARDAWMGGVLADTALTHADRNLIVRLGLHLNFQSQQCNPGYELLGLEVGVPKRSAMRGVKAGIARGWLDIEDRSQGRYRNDFRLTWPDDPTVSQVTPSTVSRKTVNGVSQSTPTVSNGASNGVIRSEQVLDRAGQSAPNRERNREKITENDIYKQRERSFCESEVEEIESAFAEFWEAFPRRTKTSTVDRNRAKAAFKQALAVADFETIMQGVRDYIAHDVTSGPEFHPKACNWLVQESWTDEYE